MVEEFLLHFVESLCCCWRDLSFAMMHVMMVKVVNDDAQWMIDCRRVMSSKKDSVQ